MKSRKLTVTFLFAVVVPLQLLAQQTRYSVKDLGTLGGSSSFPFGLNNRGQVSGNSTLPDGTRHAFLWQKGVMTDLGTLGGPNSFAFAIDETGVIAGFAETSTPDPLGETFCGNPVICLGFVWRDGVMTALPPLGGNNSASLQTNTRGQVVGQAETAREDPTCVPPQVLQFPPAIWRNGKAHELPTTGDPDGFATSINARGQVVGWSGTCTNSGLHLLLWEEGRVTDLGNLGGSTSFALFINNHEQVVGESGLGGEVVPSMLFSGRTG
jgi:probable HAF family extracellular repeat protein